VKKPNLRQRSVRIDVMETIHTTHAPSLHVRKRNRLQLLSPSNHTVAAASVSDNLVNSYSSHNLEILNHYKFSGTFNYPCQAQSPYTFLTFTFTSTRQKHHGFQLYQSSTQFFTFTSDTSYHVLTTPISE